MWTRCEHVRVATLGMFSYYKSLVFGLCWPCCWRQLQRFCSLWLYPRPEFCGIGWHLTCDVSLKCWQAKETRVSCQFLTFTKTKINSLFKSCSTLYYGFLHFHSNPHRLRGSSKGREIVQSDHHIVQHRWIYLGLHRATVFPVSLHFGSRVHISRYINFTTLAHVPQEPFELAKPTKYRRKDYQQEEEVMFDEECIYDVAIFISFLFT